MNYSKVFFLTFLLASSQTYTITTHSRNSWKNMALATTACSTVGLGVYSWYLKTKADAYQITKHLSKQLAGEKEQLMAQLNNATHALTSVEADLQQALNAIINLEKAQSIQHQASNSNQSAQQLKLERALNKAQQLEHQVAKLTQENTELQNQLTDLRLVYSTHDTTPSTTTP